MSIFERLANQRIWPLFVKELRQIGRNRRLVISLIIPPTIQIIIFGFALNPEVTNLRLGVVDSSRTAFSRELVSAFVESRAFDITAYYSSSDELGKALSAGKLDAGLVIPYDFARQRERHVTAKVQLLLDAVNSNTAQIAGGYAARIVAALNQRLVVPPSVGNIQPSPSPASQSTNSDEGTATQTAPVVDMSVSGPANRSTVTSRVALFYNPGLENAWFIVTGTLGTLLVLNGSLVASGSLVKEKETGTIEQLLMTPAEASEVITAKIAPLFILLCGDIGLALVVSYVAFRVPVRGSLVLLYVSGALCVLAGIGIGTFIATFTKSQQQAQLLGFFVNPPLALLSGSTTPIEAMPQWLQPLTLVNPIRHFADIARGIMLKGVGIEVLYPNLLALIGIAFLLVGVSAWNFRKQLG
jgi:drug efflux transport system permease protein